MEPCDWRISGWRGRGEVGQYPFKSYGSGGVRGLHTYLIDSPKGEGQGGEEAARLLIFSSQVVKRGLSIPDQTGRER